jgi:uncharacterized membrane protein YeaQ/YmgE (transglycosylase-associated protein family)
LEFITNNVGGVLMSFLAWIVLGLIAGFIASKIVNKQGEGAILDIVLGIVGAVVGGWLFGLLGASGVSGVNLYSLLVAVVGAVVVLFTYHLIRHSA